MLLFTGALKHNYEDHTLNLLAHNQNDIVELSFLESGSTTVRLAVSFDFRQFTSGIGSVKTNDGSFHLTRKRLQIVSSTGLGLSWLLTDWVNGENTMVELIDWLRNTVEFLRSKHTDKEVPQV